LYRGTYRTVETQRRRNQEGIEMETAVINTMERINQLSAERAKLYRQASNGGRGRRDLMARAKEIGAEIDALWEQRRVDRIGQREGIDLVIDRVYEHTYGKGYEDAAAPAAVSEVDEESPAKKSLTLAA
jgi:hypothetical protein